MSQEEKILNDVSETEDSGYIETYIRFNDDLEKDYCFQVKTSTTFQELFKIFKVLPIALRPNLFYNSLPIGFKVSTAPGYLTDDGAILFSYETGEARFQKSVKNFDKVSDCIWPGQLLLPIWEFNYFGWYSFLLILITWLYTDLPDFISPTPGICLTNQFSYLLSWLASKFNQTKLASALIDDIRDPVGILGQVCFFIMHIIKLGIIYLFIHTGAFNPIKLFRLGNKSVPTSITKEGLIEIGWTGTRRACPDEYKDYYRDYKIKEFGGLIPAHQSGLFDNLKNLGVFLGVGEGFNTPLNSKLSIKDMLNEDEDDKAKFKLNYEYFSKLGEFFHIYTNQEDSNLVEAIKQFRRYGILHSNESIKKIVNFRKSFGDSKV